MNPSTSLTNPSALVSFFICKYYILRFRALDVRTVRTSRDRALVYSTWDGAPPTIYIRTCQSNCFLEEGCREELKYKKKTCSSTTVTLLKISHPLMRVVDKN